MDTTTSTTADLTLTPGGQGGEERPALADYRVVGFTRKVHSPDPSTPQPGSTCFQCGQGIMNCVQIRHVDTGKVVDVGVDCAERTGLDREGLRRLWADRRASEHAEQARQSQAERHATEDAAVAAHGPHGTETRFEAGCYCPECRAAAPHGTMARFEATSELCTCQPCIDSATDFPDWRVQPARVLIDLDTGQIIDGARMVSTRYGLRWVVDRPDGDTDWYPVGPKRRTTMTNKGVTEATTDHLVRYNRQVGWRARARLEEPTVDDWGEPIVRPDET